MTPALGFTFRCGPDWNTGKDGRTPFQCDGGTPTCRGTVHIHPDDWDTDARWIELVRHEVGHTYCIWARDYSEECADRFAATGQPPACFECKPGEER